MTLAFDDVSVLFMSKKKSKLGGDDESDAPTLQQQRY